MADPAQIERDYGEETQGSRIVWGDHGEWVVVPGSYGDTGPVDEVIAERDRLAGRVAFLEGFKATVEGIGDNLNAECDRLSAELSAARDLALHQAETIGDLERDKASLRAELDRVRLILAGRPDPQVAAEPDAAGPAKPFPAGALRFGVPGG